MRWPVFGILLAGLAACGETEYRSVPDALQMLDGGSRHERIQAARFLAGGRHRGRLEDPDGEIVRALARATGDEEPWVRRWATAALGDDALDASIAVPVLIPALDDEVPAIRVAAARAPGSRAGDAATAVPVLVRIVAEEDGLCREMAGWALGEIGRPARAAAGTIIERLTSESRDRLFMSLPVLTGVEEQAYDQEHELIAIRVDSRPLLGIRARHHDLTGLANVLARRAGSHVREGAPHVSALGVHLAVDEELPWAAAGVVLDLLIHPDVRIDSVEIAVRRTEDGKLGRVRVGLPHEPMYGSDPVLEPDSKADVVLTLPSSVPGGLEARLDSLRERRPGALVSVRADPAVPATRVIEVLAAIRRAGHRIRLDGGAIGPEMAGIFPDASADTDAQDAEAAPLLAKLVKAARREVGGGFDWTEVPR